MNRKEFFDRQAGHWDERQAVYRPDPGILLDMLRVCSCEDVLEIGCGSGWLLEPLARRIAPGRLYALDFSGEMLRRAAVRPLDSPLVIIYSGAEDIPLPDQAVDRVLMINTFSQFPDPNRVLSEVSRVLRRGGRLDIKYFFGRSEINSHHSSISAMKGNGIPEVAILQKWFSSAGFVFSVTDGKNGFHATARLMESSLTGYTENRT
jgi:ubiquinone/menaquinone biosynthesis C-methylase UbiE